VPEKPGRGQLLTELAGGARRGVYFFPGVSTAAASVVSIRKVNVSWKYNSTVEPV
jgi:hypothetical protein